MLCDEGETGRGSGGGKKKELLFSVILQGVVALNFQVQYWIWSSELSLISGFYCHTTIKTV